VMIRSFFSPRTLSALAAVVVTLACADIASAQEATAAGHSLINLTAPFAVGLVVIGAALGISKLASAAYETAMIIAAALIEGFTFYALFICSQK
jgi:F-type H+-transporting ATPase subunit c